MAALGSRHARHVWKQPVLWKRSLIPSLLSVRTAIYPTHYCEPTFKKEELVKPLDDKDPRKYQPIKAARIEHTSSVYYDGTIQKMIRKMMKGGNRARVQDIMDKTLENIKRSQVEKYHKTSTPEEKTAIECNPAIIFNTAVENCKPSLILSSVKRGGVTYQVPITCGPVYKQHVAMKWLIDSCRERGQKTPMETKLAQEVLDAFHNEGRTIRKKQELHRQCEANKAYIHFKW